MLKKTCWIENKCVLMLVGLFMLSMVSLLSGCGNKGDLYLPDKGSAKDTKTNTTVKKKS